MKRLIRKFIEIVDDRYGYKFRNLFRTKVEFVIEGSSRYGHIVQYVLIENPNFKPLRVKHDKRKEEEKEKHVLHAIVEYKTTVTEVHHAIVPAANVRITH